VWVLGGAAAATGVLLAAPDAYAWLRSKAGLATAGAESELAAAQPEDAAEATFDTREARLSLRARLSEASDAETALLRSRFKAWAQAAEPELRDARLKPPKLPGLDARRNEIWRILFRIADLAGGDGPVVLVNLVRNAVPERDRETVLAATAIRVYGLKAT